MYDWSHRKHMVDLYSTPCGANACEEETVKVQARARENQVPSGHWIGPQSWQVSDVAPRDAIELIQVNTEPEARRLLNRVNHGPPVMDALQIQPRDHSSISL